MASGDTVIQIHQKSRQHPTHHHHHHSGKSHTKSSPNNGLRNHSLPPQAYPLTAVTTTSLSFQSRQEIELVPPVSVTSSPSTKPPKSRQYGAVRGSDVKPVGSGDCGKRVGSHGKGSVGIAPGSGSMHSGTATRKPPSSMHSRTAIRKPPSSMHPGTTTRKPSQSSDSHSASRGTRNPSQKGGRVKQLAQTEIEVKVTVVSRGKK